MKSLPPPEETKVQGSFALGKAPRGAAVVTWKDASGEHSMRVDRRVIVGSSPGSQLVVEDRMVSRLHAELDPREDGLWIRDLGSRNGTYVDGVFVQSARMRDGARVMMGNTDLRVTYAPAGLTVELWPQPRFGPLIGRSDVMRALFAQLARAASLEASILVLGETGTGKELVARALHDASPRAGGPFVVLDCAALPETLLDAELFGHARGAFTGADAARVGAIEAADGGTVFLDEIGELPVSMQPKLLRVLEQRTVRRLGETVHRPVNVRFVSATHRDLLTMVNAGEFREDLYFRLSVVPLIIPPLRAHPEDIEPLVENFLPRGAGKLNPEILRELGHRPWRGNVRELRNFVERAVAFGAAEALAMISPGSSSRPPDAAGSAPGSGGGGPPRGAAAVGSPVPASPPVLADPQERPSRVPPGMGPVEIGFTQTFKGGIL